MCPDLIHIGEILQRFHTKWYVIIILYRCWNVYVLRRSLFSFHVTRLGIICDVVSSVLLCSMLHPLVYMLGLFSPLCFPLLLCVLSDVSLVKFSYFWVTSLCWFTDILETSLSETRWQIITKHSIISQNTIIFTSWFYANIHSYLNTSTEFIYSK